MILQTKQDYGSPEARLSLAKLLTTTISGDKDANPYMKNVGDDSAWTIDQYGNNWSLRFFADVHDQFEIWHRYQCAANPFEEALGHWLAFKLNAAILPPIAIKRDGLVTEVTADGETAVAPHESLCRFRQGVIYLLCNGNKLTTVLSGVTQGEVMGRFFLFQAAAKSGTLYYRSSNCREFEVFVESTLFPRARL